MTEAVSPLAPDEFPVLPAVGGVHLAALTANLRYQGRDDLFLATMSAGTTVAGTFTRSLCPSAPVEWCRRHLDTVQARALVVNAGNANAFTGRDGWAAAEGTASGIAQLLGVEASEVYLASTGVIGEPMPQERMTAALADLVAGLQPSSPAAWERGAGAIRTTDTFAKGAGTTLEVARSAESSETVPVHLAGVAKGSGMIAPDMATMLGFVFCDAAISADVAQHLLSGSVARSYNRITVDSDTSTSDTVLLFCTGAAGNDPIDTVDDPRVVAIAAALDEVNLDLAHQIVRDGEGATKFVEVTVTGAEHDDAAEIIALAIANSPLVKTALAAEDANWGRIVMAVGKAGQRANRDALVIHIGDEQVTDGGLMRPEYSEERATDHLRSPEVRLSVDVGVGGGRATVWTCDLTHGYIDINAGYRS